MKKSFKHRLTARWKNNVFWSGTQQLMGKDLDHKQWVFIVGCYNSGTTLLANILSGHPAISALPDEGVMLTNQLKRPEDFNWRRMWFPCEDRIKKDTPNSRIIKRHWSHFLDDKKPFMLEKSISNTCRIPFLQREFAPAYFIHIVRNGYAVTEGIHRKAVPMKGNKYYAAGRYPIEDCALQWKQSLIAVEAVKNDLDRIIEISYEDLCTDPPGTLQKILSFLKLPAFANDYFNSSFRIHEKESPIKNMNERSFKNLSSDQVQKINIQIQDYLERYGYNLLTK